MSVASFIGSLFSGGAVKSIENIASEWIETDMETAEAKSLMVKTLDPNGKMRRDLSSFACKAYGFYLLNMVVLGYVATFGDSSQAIATMEIMKGLFIPITGAWTTIVGASFGVNYTNVKLNK